MTAADRVETAWHESGYACIAIILGIPVEAVSIRKGRGNMDHAARQVGPGRRP